MLVRRDLKLCACVLPLDYVKVGLRHSYLTWPVFASVGGPGLCRGIRCRKHGGAMNCPPEGLWAVLYLSLYKQFYWFSSRGIQTVLKINMCRHHYKLAMVLSFWKSKNENCRKFTLVDLEGFFKATLTLCWRYVRFYWPYLIASVYQKEDILLFESTSAYFEVITCLINRWVTLKDS